MDTPARPKLTVTILVFAMIDVTGMALFASGALWLAQGRALFVPGYPGSTLEALIACAGGLALMSWAAIRIIRELIGKPPHKG